MFVFCNEHHRHTYIARLKEETINDRNDRAIRVATKFYETHFPAAKIVLITDDNANRRLAKESGLAAKSVREYVESQTELPHLADLIAVVDDSEISDATKKFSYNEHLTSLQISALLKTGKLHQGPLNISYHNYLSASIFASIDGVETSILITGRENINRAIQGDVVAVELLPRALWKSESDEIVLEEGDDESPEITDSKEDKMDIEEPISGNIKPSGKVVGIIKRNWRPYCGTIEKPLSSALSTSAIVNFWAFDKRIPKIRIRTRQLKNLLGKRIVVAIDSWSKTSLHPSGHFVKVLGEVGDKATETEMLLLEHDVPYLPFSPAVNACLPAEGDKWVVTDKDLEGRVDYRGLDVCSIDPPGCTDIDDALHAFPLPNGNYQCGVHIADVSHFVKSSNPMDDEASRRGTTVYMVDKRIDMLPPLLGTNLCSLHSNVDRLAFSVIWEMTAEGEILSVEYTKSIIRSRASFTYDQAQKRLDDTNASDPISIGIKTLNKLAKKMRKKTNECRCTCSRITRSKVSN